MNQTHYALSVMCEDKVGLVALLTGTVRDLGGNIEELYQGVRLGYFVITLMATFADDVSPDHIRQSLEAVGEDGEFVVSVLPRKNEDIPPAVVGQHFVCAVNGADAPGTLHKITAYLADRSVNIEDMQIYTRSERFMLTARLTVPDGSDVRNLRLELNEILSGNDAEITLMHEDIFAATSRIDMPPATTAPRQGALS